MIDSWHVQAKLASADAKFAVRYHSAS